MEFGMRSDVKNLLGQIGQPEFPYREFNEEPGAGAVPRWPILQAISSHPAFRTPERRSAPRTGDTATTGIFRRYDGPSPPPGAQGDGENIQSLLRRLSELQG